MDTLKIGEVAKRAGVRVDTVRFYERRGLLPRPARRPSGYREFTEATVERIRFAKDLQAMGFSLDDVADMLRDVDAGTASCDAEQPRLAEVLTRLDEKIAALQGLRRKLTTTIRRCRSGACTLLEAAPRRAPRR
jgi:MerR family mercuric resistance operon transcriptional regulator